MNGKNRIRYSFFLRTANKRPGAFRTQLNGERLCAIYVCRSGEEAAFSQSQLDQRIDLARKRVAELIAS